ncbi:MAG: protein-export chaperone SecB [Rickettsiales bacterium]|nr:protein-export chaperone SecB [Rickettsiales bacterium]|tara:strand:+ start:769 stop:1236 length:468 start_codon:yes stop_codon:yes gene_type:complete
MSNNNKDSSNQENKNFQFIINTQYLKDLSFENPKAPNSLKVFNSKPEIKIDVDIKSKSLKDHGDDIFEVDLMIKGSTSVEDEVMFIVEAVYSGIFTIKNAPNDVLEKVLLIECPKFLFPFLRSIIAASTRDGGFPPLMITPIDFVSLFESKKKKN